MPFWQYNKLYNNVLLGNIESSKLQTSHNLSQKSHNCYLQDPENRECRRLVLHVFEYAQNWGPINKTFSEIVYQLTAWVNIHP